MITAELSDSQFRKISRLVYRYSGIQLKDGKEPLVRARLMKRLRTLGMQDISDYLALVQSQSGAAELDRMIDTMTTNKTGFFREADHFHFLQDHILKGFKGHRLRLWSAACSSGQEPYSIALCLLEALAGIDRKDVLVLGTDISDRMLAIARRGVYDKASLADVPDGMLRRYFTRENAGALSQYSLGAAVRNRVRLARLNLLDRWPMRGPFDVIFCRNVMIYFDRQTQQFLVDRFRDILAPGGYLIVGHSEGLSTIEHKLHYVQPAVYRK